MRHLENAMAVGNRYGAIQRQNDTYSRALSPYEAESDQRQDWQGSHSGDNKCAHEATSIALYSPSEPLPTFSSKCQGEQPDTSVSFLAAEITSNSQTAWGLYANNVGMGEASTVFEVNSITYKSAQEDRGKIVTIPTSMTRKVCRPDSSLN
jgi:hypothetical protein